MKDVNSIYERWKSFSLLSLHFGFQYVGPAVLVSLVSLMLHFWLTKLQISHLKWQFFICISFLYSPKYISCHIVICVMDSDSSFV